jgi:hypothetical protein
MQVGPAVLVGFAVWGRGLLLATIASVAIVPF